MRNVNPTCVDILIEPNKCSLDKHVESCYAVSNKLTGSKFYLNYIFDCIIVHTCQIQEFGDFRLNFHKHFMGDSFSWYLLI